MERTIWDKRLHTRGIKMRIYEDHTAWKGEGREMGYLKACIKIRVNKPAKNICRYWSTTGQ